MAWIESHQEIARHPKTRRAARTLGVSLPTMIGHLHLLWWWALDFAQDGDLSQYESIEIAEAAMWEGDPEQFVSALAAAGFIDSGESDLALHDWDEYAGKLVDQRKANAERQRRYREKQRNDTDAAPFTSRNSNVTVMSPQRHPATVPDRTVQNHTSPNGDGAAATDAEAPDAAHAAPPVGGVFERYSEKLRSAKNRVGVLMEAFTELYGSRFPPDAGRLGALAKDLGAGEFLRLMIAAAPDWRGVDDPHSYLAGCARKRKSDREQSAKLVRAVDEPKPNGTNYVALLQARQKDTRNAGENQATGEGIDSRGPPDERRAES